MDFLQKIQHDWTDKFDKRVADYLFVESSYYVPFIIGAYLYFVLRCGPRFMKDRQPYSLKIFIKLYNIIQIILNAWLVYQHFEILPNLTLTCYSGWKMDYSDNYILRKMRRTAWVFFMLKILDYVETCVFILRKKYNQVSGLHLYHHVSTLLFAWIVTRYFLVPPMTIIVFCNSFIHMIMYTYYFLSSWGPEVQKTIAPMKQWTTIAQMVQFVFLISYHLQNFWPSCKIIDHSMNMLFVGNYVFNFYMFYNFYQKTYNKPERKTK